VEQLGFNLTDKQYFTIARPVDFEVTISRSHFIASLRSISDRAGFDDQIKEIATLYPKATHYCWAYRFATLPIIEHATDAGEPSGTAGRPILGALKKYSLLNIMAVVTRYYGGIKLGVRGLIYAYGETTIKAIENTEIIIREPMALIRFVCSYDLYNILQATIQKYKIDTSLMVTKFEANISGEISLAESVIDYLSLELDNMKQRGQYFQYEIVR
jgi:uncharacterized YigZ family protein